MKEVSKGKRVLIVGGWVIAGIAIAAVTAFLFGIFVMLLWNWLMPAIFGLGQITYLQAWGLVFLSHILFKSGMHGNGHNFRHFGKNRHRLGPMKGHDGEWKKEFFTRMQEHEQEKNRNDEE